MARRSDVCVLGSTHSVAVGVVGVVPSLRACVPDEGHSTPLCYLSNKVVAFRNWTS